MEIGSNTVSIRKFFFWCFTGSLVFHLLAAWFSIGYLYQDELLQIMEFAGYKLGIVPTKTLPWEFHEQMRQAIQPFVVVALYRFLALIHLANPFLCLLLLRVFSSLLGWISLLLLTRECVIMIESVLWKKFMILLACFIWFMPYTQAHFSCESISGSLFFLSVALVLAFRRVPVETKNRIYLLWGAGAVVGLAFVVRNQTVFLIFGMGLWCIFIGKFSFKNIVIMIVPALAMVGLGFVIDYWYYGQWVCTAYNYYYVNLALNKVSTFGVTPFYYYFYIYYLNLIPPFSVFIMGAIIFAWIKFPKHVLTWICLPFFIFNSLIGHKEIRFFFPMVEAIPILLVLPFHKIGLKLFRKGYIKWPLGLMLGLNFILLLYFCMKPAQVSFGLYKFLYSYSKANGETKLITNVLTPYNINSNLMYFCQPGNIDIDSLNSLSSLINKAKYSTDKNDLFVINNTQTADSFQRARTGISLVYKSLPEAFNYSTWDRESLNHIWYVYKTTSSASGQTKPTVPE